MNRNQVISDLCAIGSWFQAVTSENDQIKHPFSAAITQDFRDAIDREVFKNGWFESQNVKDALTALSHWLNEATLIRFSEEYSFAAFDRTLGLILAGNIPMVGFHDVICGLLSGFKLQIKLSSDDNRLLPIVVNALSELNPKYASVITLNPTKLTGFDAVIGTGSDATLLHFKSYFKEIPHLLRGNRTSVAVLTGEESTVQLTQIGKDIFTYFGRGCRNVTHLMVPVSYSFEAFFNAILPYQDVVRNKKYGNNYDYNRAIHLLSQQHLLDNGFVLLMESTELHPPLAMIYYHHYKSSEDVLSYITLKKEQIQCVVGNQFAPFGSSQSPSISDFADGINTMEWLKNVIN